MNKINNKIFSIGTFILLLGTAIACSEEEPINMAPSFKLYDVTNVMRTSAIFSGSISGNLNHIKAYGFQYSLSEEFSSSMTKEIQVGENPSTGVIEQKVTGLEGGEQYYYRMYASTGASKVYSSSEFFQTERSSAPTMSALMVDSIGENMVRFKCTIEEIGDEYLIECGVSYKESGSNTWIPFASDSIVPGTANTFFVEITGLEAATKYSFRPYAKNSADKTGEETGTREGYGAIEEHTTANQLSAVVETVEPVDGKIGMNSVEMSGRVTSAIGSNGIVDEVGFCYSSTNETPNITDSHVTAPIAKLNEYFTTLIPDLTTGSTYYVRAYAKNTVNGQERIGYGGMFPITTKDIATPQVEWVQRTTEEGWTTYDEVVTATSFSRKAKITNYDKGALVGKGFVWSESNGEISVEEARKANTILEIDLNTGENIIDGTISGLKMNTFYYIRAYAIYQASGLEQIGYTWTSSFNTSSFERPELEQVTIDEKTITRNSAVLQGRISRNGNGEFLDKGFVVSLHHNGEGTYEPTLKTKDVIVLKADDNFKATVTGLKAGTRYAVRPYIISTLGGEVDTTYAWYRDLHTDDVIFPRYETDLVAVTINSLSCSMSLTEKGDGEIVEKGILWKKQPNDGSWPHFTLEDGADGIKAFDNPNNDQDTLTISGLEIETNYIIRSYVKIKLDDQIYTSSDVGYSHSTRTRGLNLRIINTDESAHEISLTGEIYDYVDGITEYGFCWSTEDVETSKMTNMIKASEPDENNHFKATIKELTPNTQYYYGVYVKIGDKVFYSDDRWGSSTQGYPTIDSNPSPSKKD